MMLKDLTSPSRWIVRRVARDRLDFEDRRGHGRWGRHCRGNGGDRHYKRSDLRSVDLESIIKE